ncbi:Gfo/Idh/MocA family oxidoreductase [Verrucomicrobia bacterium]|nr:Gfo/Idh/MocA family oxidoreductase [Verrucomicrobiota bacterium]MDB4458940.1 Gfo/Idh/MocA family oxidoreductase [bacterium]
MNEPNQPNRRSFIKNTSTTVAAGAVASSLTFPSITLGKPNSDKLKIGWVGIGGRGSGATVQALNADSNSELWAMCDVFQDKIDIAIPRIEKYHPDRVNVPASRQFTGIDGFQKVLDSGIDVVILTTSPGFRPQHLMAAVEAGVHIFCEKPMATDAPGARIVKKAIALAKEKGLSIVDGFVWRWTYAQQDTYNRIIGGDIGDVTSVYSSYNIGTTDRYPNHTRENCKSDLEWQLRRWHYFTWLSGDHVVEQAVHSVDKMLWAMNDVPPTAVQATGGRQVRIEEKYGNIYDHFTAELHWENGVKGYHFSRQIDKCDNGVQDRVTGTKGIYEGESARRHHVFQGKDLKWRWKGTVNNGYQTEHDEMWAGLRSGKVINTGDRMINTTMAALMIRMAAYTGKKITWDMAWNSTEELVPKKVDFDMKLPVRPVRMPGRTQFL